MSEQVRNELVQPETPVEGEPGQPETPVEGELGQPETPTYGENGSHNGAVTALSSSVVRRAMWRHLITLQWSWNYERMQALGYLYSMLPVIDAVYKDKAERIAAMKRHLVFYNTNPQVGSPPIFGATVALEGQHQGEAVDSLKVGLMGPFAGIGDTIQAILYRPIVAVFAASLALGGSYFGPALIFLSGILWTVLMIPLFYFGYRQGIGVAQEVTSEGTLTRVTEMVTMMGMIVIGGFVPSIMAAVKTPLTYVQHVIVQGKPVTETVALQSTLDKIVPYLLPVVFVALAYWLLRGLKLSAVWVLIILAVIAFVCGAFGLL